SRGEAPALLVHALASGPALWAQKGYLARALTAEGDGFHDDDVVPLSSFVDGQGEGDGIAVAIETDTRGTIHPCVYVRQRGKLEERPLDPDQQNRFDVPSYLQDIEKLLP